MDALATAEGVIAVVTANMARAIRVISVQRGHDPRAITRWSRSAAPDADVPMLDWSKRLVCS